MGEQGLSLSQLTKAYTVGQVPDIEAPIIESVVVKDSGGNEIEAGGTLSGEVTFVVTARDDKVLKQLNLDIVKDSLKDITDEWGILQQLNVYAIEDDPVQTEVTETILAALGIVVTYEVGETSGTWTIKIDTEAEVPEDYAGYFPEGWTHVFPNDIDYSFNFKAKDESGNYSGYKVVAFKIENEEPVKSKYGFEITGLDQGFLAGELIEGTVIVGEDGVDTTGLTTVEVTLKATTINELGYDNVKVLAPQVTQTVGSGGKLQFWAYSADDEMWFDAAVHGWGSGFPISADYDVTTPIHVFADTAGTYEVKFKLVDLNRDNEIITEKTESITVVAP